MEIKCWGSRGSIPVSGRPFLKYGGDTTCIEITAKSGETIIIDAGTGIRRLGNSGLDRGITRYHLLLTHVHWDHMLGLPFFRPLQYSNTRVVIQDRRFEGLKTSKALSEVFKKPFFPLEMEDLNADIVYDSTLNDQFSIGSVSVESIPTSHPGGGMGYRLTEDGKSFVFLTDNELYFDHPEGRDFDAYLDFAKNADILFHDGEYTRDEYHRKTGWGHSSIPQVTDLALKAGVKRLGLFHLNQERTDDQMDDIVSQYREELKKHNRSLDFFAVYCDMTLQL